MDLAHFGLQGRPFRASPDSAFYYPATTHEKALACLLEALHEDEGFCLLTSPPGLGKTLLCHCLVERLGSEITSAFLTNSHFPDRASLFQAILFDFSLPYEGKSEQELRLTLTDFLLTRYSAQQRTVLLVDEAQHLSPDLLEELRLLGNLEGARGKALQVVLAGQPDLLELLTQPELAAFRQRLAVRVQLEPLGLHEAADYLVHQVRRAGGHREDLLADEAVELLARGTQGIPRLLNQAAHQGLCLAISVGATKVDVEAALEALAMLGLETEMPETADLRFPSVVMEDEPPSEEDPTRMTAEFSAATGTTGTGASSPGDPNRRPAC
jgi:type II secretory pathway predicted ATPase ExeA